MKRKGIPQEALKLIACVTMLADHVGAVFFPEKVLLRCIGRLAFPIYAFLIAEGAHYTRDPKKYALRMLLMAVITEIPFDNAFFHGMTPYHQNVMVTLLLGFLALEVGKKCSSWILRVLVVLPFAWVAEFLMTDYGAEGVLIIAMFGLSREIPGKHWIQFAFLYLIFAGMSSAALLHIGAFRLEMQDLGALAIIPISLYSGEKRTGSKLVQWAFYLFYPVHLTLLWILGVLLHV